MNCLILLSWVVLIAIIGCSRLKLDAIESEVEFHPLKNGKGFAIEFLKGSGDRKLPDDIQRQISADMRQPLTDSDFKRAALLTADDYQPMENLSIQLTDPKLFEGDINETTRNAIREPRLKWPSGRVPYVISDQYNDESRAVIARAFQDYHEKTCVRFVPRSENDTDYIYIHSGSGCHSKVGLKGGMQTVSIGEGCTYVGIVVHELMHALGFWHEQSRSDRDRFVRINWQNIKPGMEYNFDKFPKNSVQDLGQSYDYKSVMHYGSYAFARGSEPTIVPRKSVEIGQRFGMSKTDITKINKLYDCGKVARQKFERNRYNF